MRGVLSSTSAIKHSPGKTISTYIRKFVLRKVLCKCGWNILNDRLSSIDIIYINDDKDELMINPMLRYLDIPILGGEGWPNLPTPLFRNENVQWVQSL